MIKLLNTNSFLNKIAVQEASLGKFICPKCSTFCTNSKTEYEDHLRENHIDYDQVCCIYCSVSFDFSKISNHIESHFEENLMSTNTCNLCNVSVKMDSQESVLDHLMFQHNNAMICPLCKVEYQQYCDLIEHINDNLRIVYHCTFEGCQMKTNDNEELNFHKNISGHISDSCFEEHTFNCLSKDFENQFSFIGDMDNELPLLEESQIITNDTGVTYGIKPSNVILEETGNSIQKFNFIWQLNCRRELFDEIYKAMDQKDESVLKERLFGIEKFSIGVSLKNDRKLYCCLECDYAPQYSHWDVKKHIMVVHCKMSNKESKKSLRMIEFNKHKNKRVSQLVSKNQSHKIQIGNRLKSNTIVKKTNLSKQKFNFVLKLHFRKELFPQMYKDTKTPNSIEIGNKLNSIDQYSIGVTNSNNKKCFYCQNCSYVSYYSHYDVRKHILNVHCSIVNRDAKKCLKLINLVDTRENVSSNNGGLFEDEEEEWEEIVSTGEDSNANDTDILVSKLANDTTLTENDARFVSNSVTKIQFNHILRLVCHLELFGQIFKGVSPTVCNELKRKIAPIERYLIGVTLDRSKRTFYCMNCSYVSLYSNWDVRKHILKFHCGFSNADSHKCIKMVEVIRDQVSPDDVPPDMVEMTVISDKPPPTPTKLESPIKQESPTETTILQSGLDLETPFLSGEGALIKLNYSKEDIKSVFPKLGPDALKDVEQKMDLYKTFSLEAVFIKGVKYYVCIYCGYKSHHNQGDVKKHIMAKHCAISGHLVRHCAKLCRKELTDMSINAASIATNRNSMFLSSNRDRKRIVKRSRKLIFNRQSCPAAVVVFNPEPQPTLDHRDHDDDNDDDQLVSDSGDMQDNRKRKTSFEIAQDVIKKARLSLGSVEPKKIIIDRQIQLHYSENILKNLCDLENVTNKFPDLKERMKIYCRSQVRVSRMSQNDIFICSQCNWFSWKSISAVSSHVIEMHTGIDTALIPLIEMSTKMNSAGQLISDSEINKLGWNGKPILSPRRSNVFIDLSK